MKHRRERLDLDKSIFGKMYNYKREGNTITGFAEHIQDGVNEAQALYNFGFGRLGQMGSTYDRGSSQAKMRSIRFDKLSDANDVEEALRKAGFTKEE